MNRREFLTLTSLSGLIPLIGWKGSPNILDFVDSGALGLKYKLFPVQRFILKMVYGLDLEPSERDYLAQLRDEGRYTPATGGSQESLIVGGRRSGMTLLGTVVQLYESLKLLHTKEEAWPSSVTRQVLTLGANKDLASHAFNGFTEALVGSKLRPHLTRNTQTTVDFQREDRRVRAAFRSNRVKTIKGMRASSVVFEDAAFWDERDFHDCYMAVRPYLGRITIFTSSSNEQWFRDFYRSSAQGSALTLRIPSWEANPLTLRYLREIERTPYVDFDREFGARV